MKRQAFSLRVTKEILRDPLHFGFGLGFPIILLLLMSAIQANIPVALFEISHLAPGISVFGLSFFSLFCAVLIAKDRESALLQRLYTTPMRSSDFILGYMLPLLPMALAQAVICYAVAVFLGLPLTQNILWAVVALIPTALFFISLGLLSGSVLTGKQAGSICGALLTNLTAWFSGTWFDLDLVGNTFRKIANLLPFIHAVELERSALQGDWETAIPHLPWVLGYGVVTTAFAIAAFLHQMKKQ